MCASPDSGGDRVERERATRVRRRPAVEADAATSADARPAADRAAAGVAGQRGEEFPPPPPEVKAPNGRRYPPFWMPDSSLSEVENRLCQPRLEVR